jgi:hypothetical protein
VERVLADYALRIAQRASALAPVDTGDLAESITGDAIPNGIAIDAGAGLPDGRAKFQEYGFVHYQTGLFVIHPYVRPAIEEHRDALRTALRDAIAGAL